jgi:hypothetical protein
MLLLIIYEMTDRDTKISLAVVCSTLMPIRYICEQYIGVHFYRSVRRFAALVSWTAYRLVAGTYPAHSLHTRATVFLVGDETLHMHTSMYMAFFIKLSFWFRFFCQGRRDERAWGFQILTYVESAICWHQ